MEDLTDWSKNMKIMEQEANLLENFIALQARRSLINPELEELKHESEKAQKNVERVKQILEHELGPLLDRHNKLKARVHQQQLRMLTIMETTEKHERNVILDSVPPKSVNQTQCISIAKPPYEPPTDISTPFGSDYYCDIATPCKSGNSCRSLSFYDFELPNITQQAFNEVPKYMKGRISFDELIMFLDSIILPCFNEKYQLLQKKREMVKTKELIMFNAFKAQTFLFPDQKFITQGDISRKCNKLIDRKIADKLTILRHLKILQEKRKESTICYIWVS